MQEFIQQLFDYFSGAGQHVALFVISMIPLIELRGAVPVGALMGMPWYECYFISVLGNLLPVPFIILFVRPIIQWLKTTRLLAGFTAKIESKLLSKVDKVTKYEMLGLLLFVAVPLPGTGAWTGAGIAALLGMRLRPSLLSIAAGVLVAGVIMTVASYSVTGVLGIG